MLKMNREERLRLLSVPVEKMSIAMQNLNNSIIYKSKMESLAKYIGDYKVTKEEK